MSESMPQAGDTEAERLRAIEWRARHLVAYAQAMGVNVEITPRPLKPLAMGNIELAVTVWPTRKTQAPA